MALKFLDLLKSKAGAGKSSAAALATERPQEAAADPYQKALELQKQGQLEPAIALFERVIEQRPEFAEAHYKRANALNALGRWEAALSGYDRAVALDPGYANAFCNRGTVLERLQRWDEALQSYERTLKLNPTDALACYNRGSVLKELKRFEEALASYDQALALFPDYVEAYVNRGHVLQQLQRSAEAVASYDEAIRRRPLLEAFVGRGDALATLQRNEAALVSFEQAIALKGDCAEAYIRRGHVLGAMLRREEAIASFERAIALKNDAFEAHLGKADLLQALHRHEAAVESYDRGIELKSDAAEAFRNRGVSLVQLRRYDEAVASYDRALALEPQQHYVQGLRLYAKMLGCDWSDLQPSVERLVGDIEALRPASVPMPVLALVDSPRLHRMCAEIWVRRECPANSALGPLPERAPGERIRVGYFSADFRVHPVSLLMAEVFERHDRSRFEVTAYAFGPASSDPVRARLLRAFERFVDADGRTDAEVAAWARQQGIDIAIDLTGHTQNARTGIFALRAAPIQVSYLGYPGTLGADYFDYLIADRILIPEGSARHYAEKIVYLPHSYQPNDSTRAVAERAFTREELGLPASGFVFCCFNRSFKLMPEVFDSWMRILRRVEGSVLWLSETDPSAIARLGREATSRGIEAGRLIFARPVPAMSEHLARQRAAGLFLDTAPFNAHTTASDALWAGLPVVTRIGQALPGRVAASLLTAVGLPELITSSSADFEDLAVRLATHPAELEQIRQKLARNRQSAPLFDTERFTRHLEAAYRQIYERARAGLPPDHIAVPA